MPARNNLNKHWPQFTFFSSPLTAFIYLKIIIYLVRQALPPSPTINERRGGEDLF
jgi:hypothetical protein